MDDYLINHKYKLSTDKPKLDIESEIEWVWSRHKDVKCEKERFSNKIILSGRESEVRMFLSELRVRGVNSVRDDNP